MANSKTFILSLIIIPLLLFGGCKTLQEEKTITIALAGPGEEDQIGAIIQNCLTMYIDGVNTSGELGQYKIELAFYDDGNQEENAEKVAREIVKTDALAVIGHLNSSCSISAGPVYARSKIPALTHSSTSVNVTKYNDWYFRMLSNNTLQSKFLANYIRRFFKANRVIIIYKKGEYGNNLAETFTEEFTSPSRSVETWSFDPGKNDYLSDLEEIVEEIDLRRNEGDIIFLSTHSTEGAALVKLLKDKGIQNTIVTPDSFASSKFPGLFSNYQNERITPGYYTDGIYVVSHLIFDIANEDIQNLRDTYNREFGKDLSFHGIFAQDAARLIVNGIKANLSNWENYTIEEKREKIAEFLRNLTENDEQGKGIAGYYSFDENGDVQKELYIGMYKNNELISALTQVKTRRSVAPGNNFIDEMYTTNVVYTGITLESVSAIDLDNLSCAIEGTIWFRYKGIDKQDIGKISFINALEPVELVQIDEEQYIVDEKGDPITYSAFKLKGNFKLNFFPSKRTYEEYLVSLNFIHTELDKNNLIYVKDILGMGHRSNSEIIEKLTQNQVVRPSHQWDIKDFFISQTNYNKDSLGRPETLLSFDGTVDHSQFNIVVKLKSSVMGFRRILPQDAAWVLLVVSALLSILLLYITDRLERKKMYSPKRIALLLHIGTALILLNTLETVVLNIMVEYKVIFYVIQNILKVFDILWWVVPAVCFHKFIDEHMLRPLEMKTDRTIPNVIRGFISFIIYGVTFCAILAFVFNLTVTSLLASGGVAAMIIGLAIQMNLANIFSGIAVNLERPLRIGDWVKIGDYEEAEVVNITWRSMRLKTRHSSILSIPNRIVSNSSIINYNYPDSTYLLHLEINIDKSYPMERIQQVLFNAVLSTKNVLKEPVPMARFNGYNEWSALYSVTFFVSDYSKKSIYLKDVWQQIFIHLRLADIEPAMQQQEIYLHTQDNSMVKEENRLLALLNGIEIFKPFSDKEKQIIVGGIETLEYKTGDTIVKQGDSGDSLFIIDEGALSVYLDTDSGEPIEINRMGAGDFFGEMALLAGQARTATVVADTPTILHEITKEDILPLIKENPGILNNLTEILTMRKISDAKKIESRIVAEKEKNSIFDNLLNMVSKFFSVD